MREFFHGWRRKIGFLLLTWAACNTVFWVTSFDTEYRIRFGAWADDNAIYNHRRGLIWGSTSYRGQRSFRPQLVSHPATVQPDREIYEQISSSQEVREHAEWKLIGFEAGIVHYGNDHSETMSYWIIPYWSTIPLTLLSAYLLLGKPRPKQKQLVTHA